MGDFEYFAFFHESDGHHRPEAMRGLFSDESKLI
jgi:hypothetical protein